MLSNLFEHFSTYIMMRGCDHSKYGTLMKGFVSQYSTKNDQYPKSMTDATDVMSLHPFDQAYYDRQKRARERNKKNRNNDDDEKVQSQLTQMTKGYCCHICGSDKHKKLSLIHI